MNPTVSLPLLFLPHPPTVLLVLPAAITLLADVAGTLTSALSIALASALACGPLVADGTVHAVEVLAVKTLPQVIDGLKTWIMGILAAVATLFLVIGGLRYMTAAGDPAAVEQAKGSLKAALTGYALAVLAPVILQVLQGILGA